MVLNLEIRYQITSLEKFSSREIIKQSDLMFLGLNVEE